jgi:hypothetical protein
LKTIKSYFYAYEILFDCFQRVPLNFLFQFLLHRYIEVTSLLVAIVINSISASNAHIIISIVALTQLVASLMMNETYTKIVPYLRVIYLDNRIVAYYLLLNTIIPFFFYLLFSAAFSLEPQTVQNVVLMSLLLFNNTLFAHVIHIFSFSIKDTILFYPLIVGIYLLVFLKIDFLIIPMITLLIVALFIYKIRSY